MKYENHIMIPESRLLRIESHMAELLEIVKQKPEPVTSVPKPKAYFTKEDTCDHFNISLSTLNRMIDSGRIKKTTIGRRVCIPYSEIERLESEGMV